MSELNEAARNKEWIDCLDTVKGIVQKNEVFLVSNKVFDSGSVKNLVALIDGLKSGANTFRNKRNETALILSITGLEATFSVQ